MNWQLFRLVFAMVCALGVAGLIVLNLLNGGGLLTLLLVPMILFIATPIGLLAAALFPQGSGR